MNFRIRTILTAGCFIALSATSGVTQIRTERTMPPQFQSDSCTWFLDGDYGDCCVEHDKDYFFGGSRKERSESDQRLYQCVKSRGGKRKKILARVMWLGVRMGGISFLPTPFRWGFGNKWPQKEPAK